MLSATRFSSTLMITSLPISFLASPCTRMLIPTRLVRFIAWSLTTREKNRSDLMSRLLRMSPHLRTSTPCRSRVTKPRNSPHSKLFRVSTAAEAKRDTPSQLLTIAAQIWSSVLSSPGTLSRRIASKRHSDQLAAVPAQSSECYH